MKKHSTRDVARKLRLDLRTLNRYIGTGKVPAPPVERVGGSQFRAWSEKDIKKVRKILPKLVNGRKTRYQKERAKKKGSKRASKKK